MFTFYTHSTWTSILIPVMSNRKFKSGWCGASLFLLLFLAPASSSAQTRGTNYLEDGIAAFRAERFSEAERLFLSAVEEDESDAEAHFLLARLYFETPLKDSRKARKELDRALEIEPDNIQFMVAQLIQLREESWNFLADKIRESKRRTLALEILKIDPKNAFANEEMGISYIRDFWRYRNAVQVPGFELARRYALPTSPGVGDVAGQTIIEDIEEAFQPTFDEGLVQPDLDLDFGDPSQVFLADEFDIETLEKQGVPVRDLSKRAMRVYGRALGYLNTALETNPRHRSVYDQLMKIYALRGDYSAALQMLQQMFIYFSEDPELWFYLGLSNYHAGNPEAAAKSFDRGLELSSEVDRREFNDIRFLLQPDEQKKYDQDPVAFTTAYWTSKDPRYLTTYNERKIEHYSRIAYADLLYSVDALDIKGRNTERGQILIRYGLPKSDIVVVPDKSVVTDGDRRNNDPTGVYSARPQSGGPDAFETLNTYNIWDYGDFRFVFEDPFRNGEYRLYSPSADALSGGALPWTNDYTIRARETIREEPDRYVYEAPGRQIELPYLVNAFKDGDGDRAELYVHYGIPLNEVDQSRKVIEVTAREGTFLIGGDRQILSEERRTIYGLGLEHVRKFSDASLWINTRALSAPPGTHELSVELEIGSTVAIQRREVDVPSFSGSALQMSDVMLAYVVEETPDGKPLGAADIARHGLSISPAPWSVFGTEQPIYLYFEFYNLTLEEGKSRFEMEAQLTRQDDSKGVGRVVKNLLGSKERGVSVRVPGSGSSQDEGQYLILDVSNEEAGLYTLEVRITDSVSGKSVVRTKDLFLE